MSPRKRQNNRKNTRDTKKNIFGGRCTEDLIKAKKSKGKRAANRLKIPNKPRWLKFPKKKGNELPGCVFQYSPSDDAGRNCQMIDPMPSPVLICKRQDPIYQTLTGQDSILS